jgi:uridine phosphorylase
MVQLQLLMMLGLVSSDDNFFVGQQRRHLDTMVESLLDEL